MEFEYENKGGQVDPNSPWVTSVSNRLQNFGSQTCMQKSLLHTDGIDKYILTFFLGGPSSSSPQKQSSPTRNRAQQSKPLPQTPTMKPPPLFPSAFHAIREPSRHDFSSGPENQSSPENADNEDTPEPLKMKRDNWQDKFTINNNNVTMFRDHKSSSKRTSFSDMFGLKRFSPVRSGFRKRHDRDVLAKRAHKRKRREIEKDDRITYRRPSDDSSSDDRPQPGNANTSTTQEGWMASIVRNIVANPVLPHILSFYVQLLWNVFLCFFFMYILYSFWQTIRQDVDMKSEELAAKTMAEMTVCAREYVQNKCDRDSRVPAMEMLCENWENCMTRDPHKVGRAKVSAHTFAEIFNSFIEPISYKAMVCNMWHLWIVYLEVLIFSYRPSPLL